MDNQGISFNTRKALSVHLGESAGIEVSNLIENLLARIDELEAQQAKTMSPSSDIHPIVLMKNSVKAA